MSINTPEDRELILRDKAAREGFNVPQDVIDFLVNRFDSEVGLKSALINIAMFASYRSIPISLDVAKLVIDGERVRPLSTMTPEYEAERATTSTSAPAEKRVPATPMQAASAAPKTPAASAASPTPKLAATPPAVKSEQQDDPPSLFDLPIPTPAPSAPQPQVPEHDLTAPFTVQPAQKAATPVTEPAASTIPTPEQAPVAAPISVSPEPTTSAPAKPAPVARFCSQTGKPLNQETTVPPTPVATPAPEPVVPMPMPTPAVQQAQYFQPIKEAPPQQSEAQMRLVSQTGSDVFFIPLRTQRKRSLFERINLALTRAGIDDVIQADDKVAVKIHFGEEGNTGFVSPVHARNVVNRVKELGGKPFLTDTNTLYAGQRQNAIDHINCAIANGFGYSTVGAPIIIADGLISRDSVVVPVAGGKHFESVRVASATIDADVMIVISHVKGHSLAGFGGAIKNIGMGLGSRSAKQRMHSGIKPSVVPDNCTACARCIDWCQPKCITMAQGQSGTRYAHINHDVCNGCGECLTACAHGAIAINWDTSPQDFLERTVEHAAGALAHFSAKEQNKVIYLNFLTNITPDCDCCTYSDAPIVGDIGILVSCDPVAIDQAAVDLVEQAQGAKDSVGEDLKCGDEKFQAINDVDVSLAMRYSQQLGLGSQNYRLRTIN